MAHAPFITTAELPRYGIPLEFLSQFDVRPIEVRCEAGGALGTAAFSWRTAGDEDWSNPVLSSTRAPWTWAPTGAYATVTFAAATYSEGSVCTIDEAGAVTGNSNVTATRYSVVEDEIAEKTARALSLMRPRKDPPITEWGADVRAAVAAMVRYGLKDYVGFAPTAVNVGDAQIVAENERAETFLARIGHGLEQPADITDSSSEGTGRGLMVRATGEDLRGW